MTKATRIDGDEWISKLLHKQVTIKKNFDPLIAGCVRMGEISYDATSVTGEVNWLWNVSWTRETRSNFYLTGIVSLRGAKVGKGREVRRSASANFIFFGAFSKISWVFSYLGYHGLTGWSRHIKSPKISEECLPKVVFKVMKKQNSTFHPLVARVWISLYR